jgi:alpha-tubulin suppressor-like RCC1 family protein
MQVNGLSSIVAIAAGHNSNMAMDNIGRLWTWGSNAYGQLGTGNTFSVSAPVQVANFCATTVGITKHEIEHAFSIYPNPANGAVKIKSDKAADLVLINELGQTVRTLHLNDSNNHQLSVEGLNPGIYFITCEGKSTGQKLVITE